MKGFTFLFYWWQDHIYCLLTAWTDFLLFYKVSPPVTRDLLLKILVLKFLLNPTCPNELKEYSHWLVGRLDKNGFIEVFVVFKDVVEMMVCVLDPVCIVVGSGDGDQWWVSNRFCFLIYSYSLGKWVYFDFLEMGLLDKILRLNFFASLITDGTDSCP